MRVPFARGASRSAMPSSSAPPAAATTAAAAAPLTGPPAAVDAVRTLSAQYDALHAAYESSFWATKMGLKVCV